MSSDDTPHRDLPDDSAERGPLRVPISAAAELGVSWLNDQEADRRVVLTRYGRPGAVIDSAERLDETARLIREARREVVDLMCDMAADRAERAHTLESACDRLGIDVARVRERARKLAG